MAEEIGRLPDYVRRPTPATALFAPDGRAVPLAELTRSGAALLVFTGTTQDGLDVLARVPKWERRLPAVRVTGVIPDHVTPVVKHVALLDPDSRTRSLLAPGERPMAVLLGSDGLLAGGPVIGVDEIHAFVDDIEAHLAEAGSPHTVLVTSARMGSSHSTSITLPQYRGDQRLNVDFICFNDETHPTRERAMHPRLAGKLPKMLAWETNPGYDYYVWLDSCFTLSRSDAVGWFLDQLGDHDAAFFRHSARSTIADEVDFVLSSMSTGSNYLLDRYRGEDMRSQVAKYLGDPTFDDNLLIEAGAFIYSSRIVQDPRSNVMKEWFYHNCRWSIQDQLSLPYVLHQFDTDFTFLESPSIYDCEYLR